MMIQTGLLALPWLSHGKLITRIRLLWQRELPKVGNIKNRFIITISFFCVIQGVQKHQLGQVTAWPDPDNKINSTEDDSSVNTYKCYVSGWDWVTCKDYLWTFNTSWEISIVIGGRIIYT